MIKDEYIKCFYSLFSEYDNIGFRGNKQIMKYKLQLKLKRCIPLKYVDLSLKIFREAGLINRTVIQCNSSQPELIGDLYFGGPKFIWTKISLTDDVIDKKLNSLSNMFDSFEKDTYKSVGLDELNFYKILFKEKLTLFKDILKEESSKYYLKYFDDDIYKIDGIQRYDIKEIDFINSLEKIISYDKSYFLSEKQKIDKLNKETLIKKREEENCFNELYETYNKIFKLILDISLDIIEKNTKIEIILGENKTSIFNGRISITNAFIKNNKLILSNKYSTLQIDPLKMCYISVDKSEIKLYNGGACEELKILVSCITSDKLNNLKLLINK